MSVTWHFVCVIVRLSIVLYRTCLFFFFFFDQIRPVFRKNLTPRHKVSFILSIVINYRNTQQKIMQNQTKLNQTKKKSSFIVSLILWFFFMTYNTNGRQCFLEKEKSFSHANSKYICLGSCFFLFVCFVKNFLTVSVKEKLFSFCHFILCIIISFSNDDDDDDENDKISFGQNASCFFGSFKLTNLNRQSRVIFFFFGYKSIDNFSRNEIYKDCIGKKKWRNILRIR